ncbi:MAG TPA: lytic transglycosylase domain-containing protein [Actinomycetes bacterium]
MLRPPHLNLRLRKPKISLPRIRRLHLRFRRLEVGALWALVLLAALATLPSLAPDKGSSSTLSLGADPGGLSLQDEAAARYQAWLRGRTASQDAGSAAAAAAQAAAAGLGAAAPTPTITVPTAADNDIPALALRAYRFAESWASGFSPDCKLSWSVLAGIGRIESNHGRFLGAAARFSSAGDVTPTILGPVLNGAANVGAIHDTDAGRLDGDTNWDRAVGPMQFIPSTWQSLGRDGNNDGIANPNNLFDAAVSAAGYLCGSAGGSMTGQASLRRAIFSYNHSNDYVRAVISWANFYLQQAGQGSLVKVQIPNGPASSSPLGVAAGATNALGPNSNGTPTTRARATSTTRAHGTSTTRRTTTTRAPTTTTRPPSSTTTSTTRPPTSTTEPCSTTTTSSSSSSTTTTTTSESTTTTTTLPPCGTQQADPDATGTTQG